MLQNEDIICISSIDWDFIWQGHQEIMTRLAIREVQRVQDRGGMHGEQLRVAYRRAVQAQKHLRGDEPQSVPERLGRDVLAQELDHDARGLLAVRPAQTPEQLEAGLRIASAPIPVRRQRPGQGPVTVEVRGGTAGRAAERTAS